MSKKSLDLTKYTGDSVGLIGLNAEFKICHIPFIVENDVFGALALQGSSGTGKTTIAKKLGQLNEKATGESWGIYSADKARYEDFVGCPIPNPNTGEMKIYPMPNSIATKSLILVDEINRATYENQEKWLSLIASREVDGFKAKTRYIFAAMNPVMSSSNDDVYEGVQPLDKALGERMIGLVDIPSMGKMTDGSKRKEILKATINQTNWAPTDEQVALHIEWLARAREHYQNAKAHYIEQVAEYVDTVQNELRKQTKNKISIEARRAQFIFVNILAMYAIEAVTQGEGVDTLKSAAQTALIGSFPNTLWEQAINIPALVVAHKDAAGCLTIALETLRSGAMNCSDLEKSVGEIVKLVEKGAPKEQISKAINQSIPPKEVNPFNHFAYMAAIGMAMKKTAPGAVMKEQEYSRFENFYKGVVTSKPFDKYKELVKGMKKSGDVLDFIKKNYPSYIADGAEREEDINNFKAVLESDVCWLAMAIVDMENLELKVHDELFTFVNSILESSDIIQGCLEMYEDRKK